YDITAWSLPVAFGVESYWTSGAPAGGELVRLPDEAQARAPSAERGATGARRSALGAARPPEPLAVAVPGGVAGGQRAQSAYLFEPARNGSSRLAYHLVDRGYAVAVSAEPLEAGGRAWPRGTFVVRVGRNDSTLHGAIDRLARESGVEVAAVNTAFATTAQFGTGAGGIASLARPNVAIVADEGVSQPAYGALWWSFERRYGMKFTPVTLGRLRGGDLARYNVVIVPDADPGVLASRIGKEGAEALKRWVQAGGTLVTMAGASAWAAREDVGLTSSRVVGSDTAGAAEAALAALTGIASPTAASGPAGVPGANFDVALDRTHWLTFGYTRPRLTVLFEGDNFLKLSQEGANVAVFPAAGAFRRAGFVWDDNTERLLRGTALLVDEPL
ncbi:MAG: hypothetical protein AVDCRST_MAG11-1833, partial [uncultured Gemmatimonadaceae bacterium]